MRQCIGRWAAGRRTQGNSPTDGSRMDGNRTNGSQTDGNRTDGSPTNEPRSSNGSVIACNTAVAAARTRNNGAVAALAAALL